MGGLRLIQEDLESCRQSQESSMQWMSLVGAVGDFFALAAAVIEFGAAVINGRSGQISRRRNDVDHDRQV